jgi:hypothetical protein
MSIGGAIVVVVVYRSLSSVVRLKLWGAFETDLKKIDGNVIDHVRP